MLLRRNYNYEMLTFFAALIKLFFAAFLCVSLIAIYQALR